MQRVDDVRRRACEYLGIDGAESAVTALSLPLFRKKWKNRFNAQTINAIKPTIFMLHHPARFRLTGCFGFRFRRQFFSAASLSSSASSFCREYRPLHGDFRHTRPVISAQRTGLPSSSRISRRKRAFGKRFQHHLPAVRYRSNSGVSSSPGYSAVNLSSTPSLFAYKTGSQRMNAPAVR